MADQERALTEEILADAKRRAERIGQRAEREAQKILQEADQEGKEVRRKAEEVARGRAEREAINMPIQGSAADIIKIAMIGVHRALQEQGLSARMLLQVHDELVLEVTDEEMDSVIHLLREIMGSAFELAVPLKVDVEVGHNWLEMVWR